jgi:hypothetical protein
LDKGVEQKPSGKQRIPEVKPKTIPYEPATGSPLDACRQGTGGPCLKIGTVGIMSLVRTVNNASLGKFMSYMLVCVRRPPKQHEAS